MLSSEARQPHELSPRDYQLPAKIFDTIDTNETDTLRTQVLDYLITKINQDGFFTRKTFPGAFSRHMTKIAIQTELGFKYKIHFFKIKWLFPQGPGHEALHFYILPLNRSPDVTCSNISMAVNAQTALGSKAHDLFASDADIVIDKHFQEYTPSKGHFTINDYEAIGFLHDLLKGTTDKEKTESLYREAESEYKEYDEIGWVRDLRRSRISAQS